MTADKNSATKTTKASECTNRTIANDNLHYWTLWV